MWTKLIKSEENSNTQNINMKNVYKEQANNLNKAKNNLYEMLDLLNKQLENPKRKIDNQYDILASKLKSKIQNSLQCIEIALATINNSLGK